MEFLSLIVRVQKGMPRMTTIVIIVVMIITVITKQRSRSTYYLKRTLQPIFLMQSWQHSVIRAPNSYSLLVLQFKVQQWRLTSQWQYLMQATVPGK